MPTESFTIGKVRYTAVEDGEGALEIHVELDDNPTTTSHEVSVAAVDPDDWEITESYITAIAAFNGYIVSKLRRVKNGIRYDTRPCRTDLEVQRRIFPIIGDYLVLARKQTPIDAPWDAMEVIRHDFGPTESV